MEKKKTVISSITVAVLLVLVVASSYAYFQARIASGGQTSTSVGAKTLDSFAINKGNDISLIANQDNFALGKGDLSSSTTATVSFTARNDEASSYAYDVGFYIALNEFGYSQFQDSEGILISEHPYNLMPYGNINFDNGITFFESDFSFWDNNTIPDLTCYFAFSDVGNSWGYIYTYIKDENNANVFTRSGNDFDLIPLKNSMGPFNYKVRMNFNKKNENAGSAKVIKSTGIMLDGFSDKSQIKNTFCIDNNSEFGKNFDESTYELTVVPELELTIKKNGEVLGTYDITNASSDAYIYFKEYDEDEANEVYNNTINQCMLSGLVQIDSVKYATIEACGDDLDCVYNAFDEIVNACNGDEECENLIYADTDQLYPTCDEKAIMEIYKVMGYEISANAGATTTDTWEATVTFKNLDGNQNINLGKAFEGYFKIYSYKDYSSEEIMQSNFEKCMQKWYPSFDVNEFIGNGGYGSYIQTTCNNDYESECARRLGTCSRLWWQ